MSATNAPSMHNCLFLGGPMHGRWIEVIDSTNELNFRFNRDRTYSPDMRDRYTRRLITRVGSDESLEVTALFAHESWLDEEISASNMPENAFIPSSELPR